MLKRRQRIMEPLSGHLLQLVVEEREGEQEELVRSSGYNYNNLVTRIYTFILMVWFGLQ